MAGLVLLPDLCVWFRAMESDVMPDRPLLFIYIYIYMEKYKIPLIYGLASFSLFE